MAVMQIDINDTDIINNPQPKKKEEPKKEVPKTSNFFVTLKHNNQNQRLQ